MCLSAARPPELPTNKAAIARCHSVYTMAPGHLLTQTPLLLPVPLTDGCFTAAHSDRQKYHREVCVLVTTGLVPTTVVGLLAARMALGAAGA